MAKENQMTYLEPKQRKFLKTQSIKLGYSLSVYIEKLLQYDKDNKVIKPKGK